MLTLTPAEGRFFDETNAPRYPNLNVGGGEKVYDFIVNTTGLRLRKEAMSNHTTLLNINSCSLRLVEAPSSGIRPLLNPEHIAELDALKDEESRWRKLQRWFIGLNWRALLPM